MKLKNTLILNTFIIFILLTPFIIWKNSYEGPKVFWFLTIGFDLTIFWIYRIVLEKKNIYLGMVDFFFLAWLIILVVASIFGVHPIESILGGSYRHQGVLFFFTLWLVYKTVQLFNPKEKHLLGQGLALTVLVESLLVFGQFILGMVYFGKPLGTLGEANAVAGFIGIGSYFVIQYLPKVYLTIPVIAILITASRSGILAIILNIGYLTDLVSKKVRKFLFVAVFLSATYILLFFTFVKNNLPFDTFESRQIIWPLAFDQIINKPLLGYGAESGEWVFDKTFKTHGINLEGLVIDRVHNLFLDIAMWSGILGLALFIGFLVTLFQGLKNKYQKLAFTSFIIYSFFQPLSIVHWLLLVLL